VLGSVDVLSENEASYSSDLTSKIGATYGENVSSQLTSLPDNGIAKASLGRKGNQIQKSTVFLIVPMSCKAKHPSSPRRGLNFDMEIPGVQSA
jgi:hypothetical protein